jgi:host cell surface-exposed lipoprotein
MSTTTTNPATDAPTPPGKPRKRWHQRWAVRIPALGLAGLIAIMAASGGSHPAPAAHTAPAKPAVTAPAHQAPLHKAAPAPATSAPPASQAPTPASSAPAAPAASAPAQAPAPAAPAGPTVSQQQALESAQSYLDLGSGFSHAGLIAQLDSPYGGKFSVADATWAADHSGADWNAQAVMSAQGYMKLGGFSRASLIDQLTSPYGAQFTLAQATYAANQVGL